MLRSIFSHLSSWGYVLKPEQLVLGCGSGEILSIAASAFLAPGKKLIMALPTLSPLDAAQNGRIDESCSHFLAGQPLGGVERYNERPSVHK
jgi:hypothetical protein